VRTTQRVRSSRQRLLEHDYLVAHVPDDALWGVITAWRHERAIQIADRPRP